MEQHDAFNDDREVVLQMLMDVHANHPHSLYSAGIDPTAVSDIDSLLVQVRCCCVVWVQYMGSVGTDGK